MNSVAIDMSIDAKLDIVINMLLGFAQPTINEHRIIRFGSIECDRVYNHNLKSTSDIVVHMYNLARTNGSKIKLSMISRYYRKLQCYQLTWTGKDLECTLFETEVKQQILTSNALVQHICLHHMTPLSFDPVQYIDGCDNYLIASCKITRHSVNMTLEFWLRTDELYRLSETDMFKLFVKIWKTAPIMVKLIID